MLGGGGEADPRHHSHARVYTRRKERDRERSEGDDGKAGSVVCYPEHTHTRPATVLSATPAHTLTHGQPHCWTVGTRVAAPTTAWPRNSDERALKALVSGLSLAQIPPLDIASAALSVAATRIASHLRARSPPASLPPLPPPPHAGSGDCSFPHLLSPWYEPGGVKTGLLVRFSSPPREGLPCREAFVEHADFWLGHSQRSFTV